MSDGDQANTLFAIDMGPMGPIGESDALILRVNRNCPWNRCLFSPVYKNTRFSYRPSPEVIRDIDSIRRIADLIETVSCRIGMAGRVTREVLLEVIRGYPQIYGIPTSPYTNDQRAALSSLNNVGNWLLHGSRKVFLQDADGLFVKPADLAHILTHLTSSFPSVEVVSSYARSKTCAQRTVEDLAALKEAGLSWVFVGIESGYDSVLRDMHKGVTQQDHIEAGHKIAAAGLHMAAFVMPGLAGTMPSASTSHITATLYVLNSIKPTEVRVRSLAVVEGSPLFEHWQQGTFQPPHDDLMIREIKTLIEGLTFECTFETLQMTNVLFTTKGSLSLLRDTMLTAIENYQSLPRLEQLRVRFNHYVEGGYLACVDQWGKLDATLHDALVKARHAIEHDSSDAARLTEDAALAIKSKGIP